MATLTVSKYGSGNSFGALSLDTVAPSGKKFHTGYYYALVYGDVRTLAANMTNVATTLTVTTSTSIYPSSGFVWIGNERITYTGKTSTTLTGCTRGTQGTAAAAHSIGDDVRMHKTIRKMLSNYTTARTEVNSRLANRGVLVRYSWRDIETSEGVYDFTEADEILADMKNAAIMTNGLKRMCFMVELRGAGADDYVVPDYVITHAGSEGGQFQTTGFRADNPSWYMRLWNAYTLSRFKLFLQALAAHYDDEPYFEMFQVAETAVGSALATQPPGFAAAPAGYTNNYYVGLLEATLALNAAAPNTITCQILNYDRPPIKAMIPSLVASGVALGCPNSLKDEPGLHFTGANPGIFEHFKTYKNVVPICPAIQKPEMFYSNLTWNLTNYTTGISPTGVAPSEGTVPNPTFDVICAFLKDALYQSNYIFVTRVEFANGTSNVTGNAFKDDFLTFLNASPQNVVGGGLNATRPSAYSSVITS